MKLEWCAALAIACTMGCARRNPNLATGVDLAAPSGSDFAVARDAAVEVDFAVEEGDLAGVDVARADDLAGDDLASVDLTSVDLTTVDLTTVDLTTVDLRMPDLAVRDMAVRDMAVRDFAMPDFAMPDFAMPDFAMPDFASTDLAGADFACAMIGTNQNCAACGEPCQTNGTTSNTCVLTSTGFQCKPACSFDRGDCDSSPANGCETNFSTGGMCACDACHSACDNDSSNGCEINHCDDRDEPNNTCPGFVLPSLTEGNSTTFSFAGILPAGDVDFYQITLLEGLGCAGVTEEFCAEVRLIPTSGGNEQLQAACGTTATPGPNDNLFIKWTGLCVASDDRTINFRISGSETCELYDVEIRFNTSGLVCP